MIHDFWEIIDKYDGWNRLNIQAIILNIKMVHFICQQTKILKLDGEGKTAIISLQSVYKEHTYWGWCHGKIKKKMDGNWYNILCKYLSKESWWHYINIRQNVL